MLTFEEFLQEKRNDSLKDKFQKFIAWGKDSSSPKELKSRIKELSDVEVLKFMHDFNDPKYKKIKITDKTPQGTQMKVLKAEIMKRFKLKSDKEFEDKIFMGPKDTPVHNFF